AMQQIYSCPSCGAAVEARAKFCGNCGNPLNWPPQQPQTISQYYCPQCGHPVLYGSDICGACGKLLSWTNQQRGQSGLPGQNAITAQAQGRRSLKPLKIIGTSLLGLLLFMALFIFGPAFTLNQTILNAAFVNSEVNSLELGVLADDFLNQKASSGLPAEIGNAISSTIYKLEPDLKGEINKSINSIYDYLLGKSDSLDLLNILRSTFLSAHFISALIDELDVTVFIKPMIYEQLSNWIPQELASLNDYIYPVIDEVLANQEPWIKEQMQAAADPLASYLLGDRNEFIFSIPTQPFVEEFRQTLLQDTENLPIPELALLPPALIELAFEQFFSQLSLTIPASIEINETTIGEDLPVAINASLFEVENNFKQMRDYISNFRFLYIVLIVVILLLITGICLIYREVKGATRTLGIIFLVYGIVEIICFLLARNYLGEQLGQFADDFPVQLQLWLQQFLTHALAPLQMLSIGFIIAGAVLVMFSIVYKSYHLAQQNL
ncbi:MAG: zinc ribbon domain-containing protein, partial [Dehalococcoidia bacterium]|nr:zinc ribbon domain-containing protein [Dehalococcoidia bacterium]